VSLAIVVPSRERPGSAERLIEAMRDTCRGDTKLVLGVDDDDPRLAEYLALDADRVVAGGMRQVVAWVNYLAVRYAQDYPYIGHFGDDNIPRTVGWDVRVEESLRDNWFCFGDDLYSGRPAGSLCCHIFMRSQVVQALGYMGPPCFRHMYVDPVWMAWGEALGIEFLDDVVLEHMHYSVGKSEMDTSYQASLATTDADAAAFNDYCRGQLNIDIAKIQAGAPTFTGDEVDNFRAFHNIPR
jgi:hypothetical protein